MTRRGDAFKNLLDNESVPKTENTNKVSSKSKTTSVSFGMTLENKDYFEDVKYFFNTDLEKVNWKNKQMMEFFLDMIREKYPNIKSRPEYLKTLGK